jgi:glucose-6-phosphate 1-dehydrogenase
VAVIFGATGDLSRRKLIPALFRLACLGCTSNKFIVLGVGRDELTDDEFRALIRTALSVSQETAELSDDDWRKFAPRLHYLTGNIEDANTYTRLASRLQELKSEGASTNHIFYLSTPPSLAPRIVAGLGAASLSDEDEGWSRIVVEKPFGRDLASARELNEIIARVFREEQVYRIDHYLGKETVRNILVFRFGNSLFEPVWNRNYVDYVEITAAESLGVGTRAGYYEEAGALRDMVANHLLQLLALTAMEPPVAVDADSVRDEKIQVWRSMKRMTPEEVETHTVRGQYVAGKIDGQAVSGYRNEEGVSRDSQTETYVAVEFRIENWRWTDVPFYVRTGKRLGRTLTEIAVHLKRPPKAFFSRLPEVGIEPNVIVLRIQPDEGVNISFASKQPGMEMLTSTVQLTFCYQKAFADPWPTAYETLLLDVMQGDATLFLRRDGVEAQWKLITPILEAWSKSSGSEVFPYRAGSDGPEAADQLLTRSGHWWSMISDSFSGCEETPLISVGDSPTLA